LKSRAVSKYFSPIRSSFQVSYRFPIHFTEDSFKKGNPLFSDVIRSGGDHSRHRVFFVIDKNVAHGHPDLTASLSRYFSHNSSRLELVADPMIIPGGESCKNNPSLLKKIYRAVDRHNLCRHSYIVAVGGGALLDLAGFVAATAHRGLRHIRMPSTVLSQSDSGVGVKNGINLFRKKNFLGTFHPPFAVINDFQLLSSLPVKDKIAGLSESVKVALLKDPSFFAFLEDNCRAFKTQHPHVLKETIYRCARWHNRHIVSGGDPFEQRSSRPLDFGHWAAHHLEYLSRYRISHGEAVSVGAALDLTYAFHTGLLKHAVWERILTLLVNLGLPIFHPLLERRHILRGLEEFRRHLGGPLTILLLKDIARPVEVRSIDHPLMIKSIRTLKKYAGVS
jgi:3-dehydroquinate synthase